MADADERVVPSVKDFKSSEEEDNPNNPQNWSLTAKLCTYLTICSFTFLANTNSSNFTVAVQAIVEEFHVNQTQAGSLVCFNVFLFGVGNIFWVPLMRVIGKRPVYLLSMLMLCMMNVWSSRASSYNELLASRIVSGFAAAAADATVPAVVADMVAAKDRGHYMMFFHLAMTAGLFVGPMINAFLVQQEDWRWMCYLMAIAVGVVFVMSIFTIRETSYLKRHQGQGKRTQLQWMSMTIGYNREASFFQTLLDILANATYPPILWCSFTIGISVGWNIVVQLTCSRTFTKSPYNWEMGTEGTFLLSGFIGAVLAFYLGGRLIDIVSTRSTIRHGGIRMPEYRLPAIAIPGVIGPAGILIFGLCIAHKTHWVGPAFGFAMQAFGLAAISNVAVTYCLDSYRPVTGEALVIIFVIRNTIGMLLSLYTANWIEKQGPAPVFGEMTAIQVVSILFAIPLYIWGRRLRDLTSTYGPMKRFQHD
ncbi:major facilitator superfamily domain-containing protein [Penicillium argentinense]|uniref:Major facilitator superfamily domain-containing protein n=1 Tax=Penicillium argentinense TaxID=1131581 RepID=A0A9W9KEV8_9EURO|nr:major facilitator superfamily domain-containing protein [Penicillium argentinense]KAJ5102497.1 major facilitator superfamily domain-containing protein [Penicillium argentinense]